GVARERVHVLAHVELLARRRLRTGELAQPVVAVEAPEAAVAYPAERQRRDADERQHRVDRGAAGAQLRGDLAAAVLREHRRAQTELRGVRARDRVVLVV